MMPIVSLLMEIVRRWVQSSAVETQFLPNTQKKKNNQQIDKFCNSQQRKRRIN